MPGTTTPNEPRHEPSEFAKRWASPQPTANERAASRRIVPRKDGLTAPAWFTLFAAAVPAVPYRFFLPFTTLFVWLPVWVALFFLQLVPALELLYAARQLSPMLVLCFVVAYRGLSAEGWSGLSLLVMTLPVGFLQNLVLGALWDTLEPVLCTLTGLGEVERVKKAAQRVTAASSIRAGNPARGAAAAAFTQQELDRLAAHDKRPWDPDVQACVRAYERSKKSA